MSFMTEITATVRTHIIEAEFNSRLKVEAERKRFSPFAWLQRTLAAYARWRRLRSDEHFLLSQPDYILKDMGISRAEIEGAVRGSTRRG